MRPENFRILYFTVVSSLPHGKPLRMVFGTTQVLNGLDKLGCSQDRLAPSLCMQFPGYMVPRTLGCTHLPITDGNMVEFILSPLILAFHWVQGFCRECMVCTCHGATSLMETPTGGLSSVPLDAYQVHIKLTAAHSYQNISRNIKLPLPGQVHRSQESLALRNFVF